MTRRDCQECGEFEADPGDVLCYHCKVRAAKPMMVQNDPAMVASRDDVPPPHPRPEIDAGIGDLAEATAQAQDRAAAGERPRRLLLPRRRARTIETDDDGRPFTRPLGVHHLKHHLARAARYIKITKAGVEDARPPMDVVQDLLASPERMWPTLKRIVSVPVFAADGSLCQEEGYNTAAAAWYHPGPSRSLTCRIARRAATSPTPSG